MGNDRVYFNSVYVSWEILDFFKIFMPEICSLKYLVGFLLLTLCNHSAISMCVGTKILLPVFTVMHSSVYWHIEFQEHTEFLCAYCL